MLQDNQRKNQDMPSNEPINVGYHLNEESQMHGQDGGERREDDEPTPPNEVPYEDDRPQPTPEKANGIKPAKGRKA